MNLGAASGRAASSHTSKIRVLVVDDSVVARKLLSDVLSNDPEIELAGTASNGLIALQRIPQINPDVVTLDVDMPDMDGLETLRRIRKQFPALRVVMLSALTEAGASVTLQALSEGANDYVTKPSTAGPQARPVQTLKDELLPKIKQFFRTQRPRVSIAAPKLAPRRTTGRVDAIAIGVSTGGPLALAEVIGSLPADLSVPVLVVQHMPPVFTKLLAGQLASKSKVRVEEGTEGAIVKPGHVHIAPGGYHMTVRRNGNNVAIALNQDPPENSCRPAVDVLFRSINDVYGGNVVAVILTGMGQDGLRGVKLLKQSGAYVIAQDEASSVVWGMPGFVVQEGLADSVADIHSVTAEILRRVK